MTIFLPLYFIIVIGLSMWDRKTLARLPDDERLKVLDAMSKASLYNAIPAVILVIAFFGFRSAFPHALRTGLLAYLILMVLVIWGGAYVLHRKLAGLGISPSYLRVRIIISVVRGLTIGLFLAGVFYTTGMIGR